MILEVRDGTVFATGWELRHDVKPKLNRDQKVTILDGVNSLVTLLVVLQLWLLTATMNAWLGGDTQVVWPAAAASFGLFGGECLAAARSRLLHCVIKIKT